MIKVTLLIFLLFGSSLAYAENSQSIFDIAISIPGKNIQVGLKNYNYTAGTATFAIIQNGSIISYEDRSDITVSTDLELLTDYYTFVTEMKESSLDLAFARKTTPRVVVIANYIDYSHAPDFFDFLENKSIEILYGNASGFAKYKNERFIVILGGPDALDGIGEIIIENNIISEDEKNYLRIKGNRAMFVKMNLWRGEQRVFIIAGSDRNQTKQAHIENREELIRWI